MFNLQGSELIIILLLALVVLGPEKLPDAMRKLGQFYAELKKMSSGFQQEFRSVVDEPLKEMRDTANLLRDSADFTKLQDGERGEKPKSAEMASADPTATPTDDVPFTDAAASTDGEALVDPEPPRPRPFSGGQQSSAAPRPVEPTAIPAPPLPFAAQAPIPTESTDPGAPDASATGDDATVDLGPDDPATGDDATVDLGPDDPAAADEPSDAAAARPDEPGTAAGDRDLPDTTDDSPADALDQPDTDPAEDRSR